MIILKADLKEKSLREKLLNFLKPHEKLTIQIIVHIKNPKTWCHVYYVEDLKKIVGVAVYLNPFKSFYLFGKDEKVIQNLTKKILETRIVKIFASNTFIGKIAYKEFEKYGYKSIVNPYNEVLLILDLDDFNPIYLKNENIRLINKKDEKNIAILSKHLKSHKNNKNIDQEDLDRIFYYLKVYVLEKDNKVVSIVASDGVGFDYFQIMHVITDEKYRNRNYAKAIVSKMIIDMKKKGCNKAMLITDKDNLFALKCYKKLGFKIDQNYFFALFMK